MSPKRQKSKMSTKDAIAIATKKKTLAEVQGITESDFDLDFNPVLKKPRPAKQPKATTPATTTPEPETNPNTNIDIYNIDVDKIIDDNHVIDIKAKLTRQELDFLEIYLENGKGIDKAMIQAGYGHYSQDWRYQLAKKIVRKYEIQAEDARNIFRDIGLGESQVARNIKELTENAKSEMVKLQANALAAKCLRLTDEPQKTHQGVNIIINCTSDPGHGGPGAPGRPVEVIVQGEALPPKPLQITK